MVVRTAKGVRRPMARWYAFDGNAAVLLNNKLEPIGTRIFGPVTRELRTERFAEDRVAGPEVLWGGDGKDSQGRRSRRYYRQGQGQARYRAVVRVDASMWLSRVSIVPKARQAEPDEGCGWWHR